MTLPNRDRSMQGKIFFKSYSELKTPFVDSTQRRIVFVDLARDVCAVPAIRIVLKA
jgi:hypothetical protein